MDSQTQKEKYEELLSQNKKMKRRFLIILALLCAGVLLMFLTLVLLHFVLSGNADPDSPNIHFYAPYDGDIFISEEYLALDRRVFYYDGSIYLEIKDDSFDPAVLFLKDFLEIMTRGDTAAYNASFTRNPGQKDFSQQMIYEAQICYEKSTVDGGDKLYTYRLEYRIHRNDGTLRDDVGSDGMRPQWALVRVRDDGRVTLDSLTTKRP